jgi:thymidylate kinase
LKTVLISFSGIDGAGKSTQIEKLCQYFGSAGVPVSILTFWDNVALFAGLRAGFSRRVLQSDGAVGSPERPAQRRDKNAQAWPLLIGRGILHLFDLINLHRIVRKARSTNSSVVIFDRYLYDQLAALPLNSSLARAYATLLIKLAPKPDISYLLDAVPESARARKPEYPLEFMRNNRSSYLELRRIAGLQLIPAGDPDDVHTAIVDRWNKFAGMEPQPSTVRPAVVA